MQKPEIVRHPSPDSTTDLFASADHRLPGQIGWHREEMARAIRLEDRYEEDRYTLRAELPGVDPEKDVVITVADGVLTIAGQRREEKAERNRSEFRYGAFVRRVALPAGAAIDQLTADYRDGILEIVVPLHAGVTESHRIPISRSKSV